jgi:hypothetical protein
MKSKLLVFVSFVAVLFIGLFFRSYRYPPILCNGSKLLCDKKINDIAYLTSHNAMGVSGEGFFGPTQEKSVAEQLQLGVRALMIDTHYFDAAESIEAYFPDASPLEILAIEAAVNKVGFKKQEGTYSCHIICNLGYTPLTKLFSDIKTFLDNNPHEVLFLLAEDKISVDDTEKAFTDSGLLSYVYTKPENSDWPTLRELIKSNKRLVVMAEVASPPPAWYNHMWDYFEETPYSFKESSEMNCAVNRGGTGKDFFLINNWIEKVIPRKEDAEEVNDYNFLLTRVKKCQNERVQKANFIGVNFSDLGDGLKVVKTLNGFE